MDGSISVGRERKKLKNTISWIDPSVLDEKEKTQKNFVDGSISVGMRKKKARNYYFVGGSISVGQERKKLGNIILWIDPSVLDEKEKSSKILFCGWIHQCWTRKKKAHKYYFVGGSISGRKKKLGNNLWMDLSALDEKEKRLRNIILGMDPSVLDEKEKVRNIILWMDPSGLE